MSAPRAIAELVVSSIRIFGKAMAAAGRQAAANARHKPEGNDAAPSGGKGKSEVTSQLGMSVEEAYMILNVKKDESMERILENYERIFAANGPPPPPKEPAPGSPEAAAAAAKAQAQAAHHGRTKKPKGPTHSHYLQSKVYRALERIKAERAEELAAAEGGAGAEGAVEGAAAGAAEAEAAAKAGEQQQAGKEAPKQ